MSRTSNFGTHKLHRSFTPELLRGGSQNQTNSILLIHSLHSPSYYLQNITRNPNTESLQEHQDGVLYTCVLTLAQ
ncbi:unnamed protein product [Allacma fusca]|uniref:Uncharacterized protein n=1 Tax=Allacma fusca TaxID=39272 RepID=A0A8J2PTQ6_9HEXA|nr:unnamed protein product [Allacma fusca]